MKTVGSKMLHKAAVVLFIILAWEITARSGIFPSLVFPRFSAVLQAFGEGIFSGLLLEKTAFSLLMILEGMAVSIIIAVFLSFLSSVSTAADSIVEVLNSIFHPLPGVALLPVAILWFGMGKTSLLFIIIHSVVWPMVISFSTGFKAIPQIYIDLGHNFGLRGFRMLWGIMLPSSLPYILSGINIGWARAWRSVIAAEMVFGAAAGSAGGLGWHIYISRYLFDIAGTFAALLAIVIVGILVEEFIFKSVKRMTVEKWGMTS